MTAGSALYLLMCLLTFGAFTRVLYVVSAQQDRLRQDAQKAPDSGGEQAKAA
nr:hypothetical protein [uncultured Rhodopila sp.]